MKTVYLCSKKEVCSFLVIRTASTLALRWDHVSTHEARSFVEEDSGITAKTFDFVALPPQIKLDFKL